MFQVLQDFRPDIVRLCLAHLLLVLEVGLIIAVRLCAAPRAPRPSARVRRDAGATANDRAAIVAARMLTLRWEVEATGRLRSRWATAAIPPGTAARPRPALEAA
jgi:hypothetical protein